MRYYDFDVWIDARGERGYPLRASCPPQGEARDVATLDADVEPLLSLLAALGRGEVQAAELVRFGSLLYGAVFRAPTGDVEALFERSYGGLRDREREGLRIRLRLEPPKIACLPWELLYSPRRERFLGTTMDTPVVRYVEVLQPVRPLPVSLPLRMLVLIPRGAGIDAQAERAGLAEALRGLDKEVQLEVLEGVTRTRFRDALVEQRFHIVHFIGHGGFQGDRPFLLLDSERLRPRSAPSAGEVVRAGARVNLTVAVTGVRVPDLTRLDRQRALSRLREAGLALGQVSPLETNAFEAGLIAGQRPRAGTLVPRGTVVHLQVASAPATCRVPPLRGQTEAGAKATLSRAGLTLGRVQRSGDSSSARDPVTEQSPSAGSVVPCGTAVAVWIPGRID